MGFFSGFGGDKSNSTSSSTTQASNTADQSGDGGAAGFGVVRVASGTAATVNLTRSGGLDGAEVVRILSASSKAQGAAQAEAARILEKQAGDSNALTAAVIGSQTETGRLIGRLAVPVLVVVSILGIVFYLTFRKK